MSQNNTGRILEAIDQLRRRKARPDIQRICNYLFRRFAVNSVEAKNDLQWCVDNNVVLKVEYKGSISYRNAAKKLALSNKHRDGQSSNVASDINKTVNNRKFAQLLTNAFGELIVQEPDYLELGIPAHEIIGNILSKDSVRYTKKYISILIEKEVEHGGLIKMKNGNYLMGPVNSEDFKFESNNWKTDESFVNSSQSDFNDSSPQNDVYNIPPQFYQQLKQKKKSIPHKIQYKSHKSVDDSMDSDDKRIDSENLRVGGRRKKVKKVFDPSDNHVPKKRGRPAGSLNKSTIEKNKMQEEFSRPDSRTSSNGREQGGVCSVCHNQNKRGPNDRMVACRECSNKAHFSCLNGDDMMLRMYPDNTWQCPHCKTCVVCVETSDAGYLIVCSVCADAYHGSCHQPAVTEKIKNGQRWLCINCQKPDELIISDIGNPFRRKSNSNDDNDSMSGSEESTPSNYRSPVESPSPSESPEKSRDSPENGSDCSDAEDPSIDPSIPDASNWTYEEVYQYFAQYFPREAKIFREQEIDGRSLLLLRRMDVLTQLKLKLGPALKIYRHVVKLQVRRDDPKLYWL
ncbi:unnamed protein product [Brassicogethes aeneus]|uniref:Uncharacterized protein n=1 Tax=Brassicogethes aeneus TaxID=1431903 RepID=A0A9P0B6B5_BRAAE|nr:unnamed protein product [Brassicogethes aeneus]